MKTMVRKVKSAFLQKERSFSSPIFLVILIFFENFS